MYDNQPIDPAFMVLPSLGMLFLLNIIFAVGNGFVAARLGKSAVLWVIVSLIPVVNYFFMFYVVYAVILGVLRRLNAILDKLGTVPA
jgi:hypothetical protein